MSSSSSSSSSPPMKRRTWCPYLDTINRTVLDFDSSDKSCSATLEMSSHIYACLVCGKYFRGRGRHTPAYRHSVDEGHYVYVHLTHGTFWCLPEDYEIVVNDDADGVGGGGDNDNDDDGKKNDNDGNALSLLDIRRALNPRFTRRQVSTLDSNVELSRDLHGRRYLPGYVGLNNVGGRSDYINAVVQALVHVRPLRDYFLLSSDDRDGNDNDNGGRRGRHRRVVGGNVSHFSPLARSFSLLLRNMWSSRRFKSHVDPYEFVQEVSSSSNGRYRVGVGVGVDGDAPHGGTEAGEFLSWLLHQLHLGTTMVASAAYRVGGGVGGGKRMRKRMKTSGGGATGGTDDAVNVARRRGGGGGGGGGSIIHDTFMGRVEVTTIGRGDGDGDSRRRWRRRHDDVHDGGGGGGGNEILAIKRGEDDLDDGEGDDRDGSDDEETIERRRKKREAIESLANETIIVEEETVTDTNFLHLTLDIPEKPLFKDADGGLVIPQEPLVNVLRKFDGITFGDVLAAQRHNDDGGGGGVVSMRRRYRLRRLPDYLVLHLSRFKRNGFTVEKNPTIVMFPVRNFDLGPYVFPEAGRDAVPTREEVERMTSKDLKDLLIKYGRADLVDNAIEKDELIRRCLDFVSTSLPDLLSNKYDLVANITHDVPIDVGREGRQRNPLEEGSYRCHVRHDATGQWYEIQDLAVRETMPQLISVSESYLLIFERKGAAGVAPAKLDGM
ncbi:hypothetical protein ACHAXA_003988 [Cyclostephanos tholiformis]|uniref:U4/U6.U5 tri-snRNP-associated protein 2 n=1 Tax=Cyclostephanos tholiformis TaxID=382380 RepID=A0ABD3R4N4_9STRA